MRPPREWEGSERAKRRRPLQWQIGKHHRNTKERDEENGDEEEEEEEDGERRTSRGRGRGANDMHDGRGGRSHDLGRGFGIASALVPQLSQTDARFASKQSAQLARLLARSLDPSLPAAAAVVLRRLPSPSVPSVRPSLPPSVPPSLRPSLPSPIDERRPRESSPQVELYEISLPFRVTKPLPKWAGSLHARPHSLTHSDALPSLPSLLSISSRSRLLRPRLSFPPLTRRTRSRRQPPSSDMAPGAANAFHNGGNFFPWGMLQF